MASRLTSASISDTRSGRVNENQRPENLRASAITNEHSPGKYRVNGLVVNIRSFQQAFQLQSRTAMVRENRCRVW